MVDPERVGEVILPASIEMVLPGDNVSLDVELISPVAMEIGTRFGIQEGGLIIGVGVVTQLNEN